MPQLKLIRPTAELSEQFLSMCAEYTNGYYIERTIDDFHKYLQDCHRLEHEELPDGWLKAIVYWLIDENNNIIGTCRLRPEPYGRFLQIGGHIGYDIKPSARNKGYGSEILRLTLLEAVKINLPKILVTCDDDNTGSWKIIEKNDGVLENKVIDTRDGKEVRRYWIDLNKDSNVRTNNL